MREFKPYVMRYLHGDPNYEPVLRDILEHESAIYDRMTKETHSLRRGASGEEAWKEVFGELHRFLKADKIEELFEKLQADFNATCARIIAFAEEAKLMEPEVGGEGG